MTIPSLVVNQNGISQVSSDELNGFMSGGAVVSTLRSFIGITGMTVSIIGFSALNDGGFGFFAWNAGGTSPDDNGVTTIVPNGSANGCWTRLGSTSSSGTIVNSITSPNNTISISASSGTVSEDINLNNANVWIASQTIPLSSASTAVTQANGDNTTKVATDQFVLSNVRVVPTQTIFTSGTGSYTPAGGTLWIKVRMCGGGGGGGGTQSGFAAGGNGGATIFNSVNANGGTGGAASPGGNNSGGVGGAGGTSGTGSATIRIAGNTGTSGQGSNSNFGPTVGGQGAPGSIASAGAGGVGGGGQGNSGTGGGGGGGEYVELWIASLSAPYSYTVGAAGAAGASSGTVGKAGIIIIEEYYVG